MGLCTGVSDRRLGKDTTAAVSWQQSKEQAGPYRIRETDRGN
ncbi:MAG: hypothetical protein OJF47_001912 [Nitrospira sp.]|nr:MAG: hypothetical protein OJF47_001912 [Nitrospira sp.]